MALNGEEEIHLLPREEPAAIPLLSLTDMTTREFALFIIQEVPERLQTKIIDFQLQRGAQLVEREKNYLSFRQQSEKTREAEANAIIAKENGLVEIARTARETGQPKAGMIIPKSILNV